MNRGLLARGFRESWLVTLLFGLALCLVEVVFAVALPVLETRFAGPMLQMPFFQGVFQAVLGADATGAGSPGMFRSIAWVHPVVLTLVWAHGITLGTRVPAGEVDRGTIDILLGLPVSRWQLWVNESLLSFLSGLLVVGLCAAGNLCGSLGAGSPASGARTGIVAANLWCLSLAVAGVAWLASSLSDRRGRAVGIALGAVLAIFLIDYLAQFWSVAARVSFLTPLHYYHPTAILRDGAFPMRDMLVLVGGGVALWLGGGLVFARRDLSTN